MKAGSIVSIEMRLNKRLTLLRNLVLFLFLLGFQTACVNNAQDVSATQTAIAGLPPITQTAVAQGGGFQVKSIVATVFAPMPATPTLPAKDSVSILKFYLTQTALANPSALPLTATPTPTGQPQVAPAGTPAAAAPVTASGQGIDWHSLPVIGFLIKSVENLGDNPFLVALLASLLTLFFRSFNQVMTWLGKLAVRLWSLIRLRGADYEFENDYLDWMINQHRHLGVLPAQVIARRWGDRQHLVDLEDVFVRVSLSSQAGDDGSTQLPDSNASWSRVPRWVRLLRTMSTLVFALLEVNKFEIFNREFDVSQMWYFSIPHVEPSNPSRIINRNKRLVLRGNPGSGKTTLLRYLAVTCARALRQNAKDGDKPNLLRDRLYWSQKPFPILVKLSKYGNVTSWHPERSLLDVFKDELPADLRRRCPSDFFERRLKERPCLILLDALDELGSSAARMEMALRINSFLEIYEKPMHRVVVTTRIVGYEGQLNRFGFQVRTVQPLQEGDVRALIKLRYQAIGISETIGKSESEARAIQRKLQERAQALIFRVENTPPLGLLANNPLLLSLIVLVHFLKVELPDERVLLYRDCVEILTERWQQYRREEAGAQPREAENLSLTQKLILLKEIAFAMQQNKHDDNSQAVLRKDIALRLITKKLPEIISITSQQERGASEADYLRYAEKWIMGIQESSGILVEVGLDSADGEPLIGFSHLTFQEYLAAAAIHETPAYKSELWRNLHNTFWREVVLLYTVIANDTETVVRSLLEHSANPEALLLAGSCLGEKTRQVDVVVQRSTLDLLKQLFLESEQLEVIEKVGIVFGNVLTDDVVKFLIEQLQNSDLRKVEAALHALGNLKPNGPSIELTRRTLLDLLEKDLPAGTKITTRECLARIGDPRFIQDEPIVCVIPAIPLSKLPYRPVYSLQDLHPDANASKDKWYIILLYRIELFFENFETKSRNLNIEFIASIRKRMKKQTYIDAFSISKYPITNIEFGRFVEETGYPSPENWPEGRYALERGSHPVTDITTEDATAYCDWLSRKNGRLYWLPSEYEWEIAAGGLEVRNYPWGEEFEKGKANTKEAGYEDTTPVGTFSGVSSPYGLQDTCGNVNELTYSESFVGDAIVFIGISVALLGFWGMMELIPSLFYRVDYSFISMFRLFLDIPVKDWGFIIGISQDPRMLFSFEDIFLLQFLIGAFSILLLPYPFELLLRLKRIASPQPPKSHRVWFIHDVILRGGSWDRKGTQTPTTDRHSIEVAKNIGFRVARAVQPGEIQD